jgi:alkylated DNA repair dioxygenase AlkB
MAVDYTGYEPPAPILTRALRVPHADVLQLSGFIRSSEASGLFEELQRCVGWRDEQLRLFGRQHRAPRRVAWYGDPGIGYSYSGQHHRADGWPNPLWALRQRLQRCLGTSFNFVLANLYRDGDDAMGLHADDESALGVKPIVASLSFGDSRRFRLVERYPSGTSAKRVSHTLTLRSGDLLLMWGDAQKHWLHGIPRTKKPVNARINLTFRNVL